MFVKSVSNFYGGQMRRRGRMEKLREKEKLSFPFFLFFPLFCIFLFVILLCIKNCINVALLKILSIEKVAIN